MADDHFLNLQPGTIVNGRYEIVKSLGTGSMGMVYACRHRELGGHLVAMKVLFAEVARDEVAAARFRNEIVASYGVSHPNVVRAYEYFRDGDLVAFTMEYVGGGDLADRIGGDEPMPISEIIRLLQQMCSGVQAIHEAGIVHRDLKPENILLTEHGDAKITDFGIARTGTGPKLTEHGGVVGTIDYVSPEYLERGEVDARSDIYALGVMAYEMITGESPFQGKSVIETMTMRLRTDPIEPQRIRVDCPAELSAIVMKALRRDPKERYQRAAEVLEDLKKLGMGTYVVEPKERSTEMLSPDSLSGRVRTEPKHRETAVTTALGSDDYSAYSQDSYLEPVLSGNTRSGSGRDLFSQASAKVPHRPSAEYSGDNVPAVQGASGNQVSVSQSRLPSARMQELSQKFYPQDGGLFRNFFIQILGVCFLGIFVGMVLLYLYDPAKFSGSADSVSEGSGAGYLELH